MQQLYCDVCMDLFTTINLVFQDSCFGSKEQGCGLVQTILYKTADNSKNVLELNWSLISSSPWHNFQTCLGNRHFPPEQYDPI